MLYSELFSKTAKNLPEGEESKNAKFLIKGGFIQKSSAGVYSLLPLGLKVLNKITAIVREEMNALGAEELLMPALIHRQYWEKSQRWNVNIVYKTSENFKTDQLSNQLTNGQYGLGWTHEEVVADIATRFINSYKDLPKAVYQIQTKFRAEPRAQAGLLRGREFLMKDLYSFHADKKDLDVYYQKVLRAYQKILKRLSLKSILTEAGGGAFTKEYTHEFQVLNPVGEDAVYYCQECGFSQNAEIYQPTNHKKCPAKVQSNRAIEVANIFKLGTRFSESFGLNFLDKNGAKHPVVMGSYGIGLTRLMGTLVEKYHDDKGILWPEAVSPFKVQLLSLGETKKVKSHAQRVYKTLVGHFGEAEILYDERVASAGEKLNDADLLGAPWRTVVSEKTIALSKVELKNRSWKESKLVNQAQYFKLVK